MRWVLYRLTYILAVVNSIYDCLLIFHLLHRWRNHQGKDLPSVDELVKQSKRRKGLLSGLRDAHTRMKDTDFVDVSRHDLGMLSEEELVCWLVAKLDFLKTIKLFSAVNMVPDSVTAKQRLEMICKCCGIPESKYDEMGPLLDVIDEHNVDPGVAAFEDPLVLAPPVSHTVMTAIIVSLVIM